MYIYVVKSGDNVYDIAKREQLSQEWIISVNGLSAPEELTVGQALVLPRYKQIHRVQSGETLSSIALHYGETVRELYQRNPQLQGTSELEVGEDLVITLDTPPQSEISVNGYVYPYIEENILRQTLPYLTYLTVFSYGFRPDGSLVTIDDTKLLRLAGTYGVAPILLLSTLTDDGVFDNNLSSELFQSPESQEALIENLITLMKEKGYRGIDIDFEYVYPQDKDAYADFLNRLQNAMEKNGFFTVVSLAPKTSSAQSGLLYEGHSYSALGNAADAATIMAYEWGYTYGPPMAIAPINKVSAVLDYAVTEIPSKKIWLGTPNYGYDFLLPYQAGVSMAKSISNTIAPEIAFENDVEIQFDNIAKAPFFRYTDTKKQQHEVWFEDARSVNATADLIDRYGISSLSVWNIMRYFPQLWQVLISRYKITQIALSSP